MTGPMSNKSTAMTNQTTTKHKKAWIEDATVLHYAIDILRYLLYIHPVTSTGRHYEVNDDGEHVYTYPFTPLEVFQVKEGKNYYFRVISSAFTFPFVISIDGHPLHVVASDGFNFMTEVVDSLIITSGERFDFWIEATNPGGLNRFWLRAETLELESSDNKVCIWKQKCLNKMAAIMYTILSNIISYRKIYCL